MMETNIDLRWLCAVLNPSDMAPHRNFERSQELSAPSLLSLLTLTRIRDYDYFFEKADKTGAFSSEPDLKFLLQSAKRSVIFDDMRAGSDELVDYVLGASQINEGCRAAVSLFACLPLAELDEHDLIIEILNHAIEVIRRTTPCAERSLVLAALLQQKTFRFIEISRDPGELIVESQTLLEGLHQGAFRDFALSRSVSWSASESISMIIHTLTLAIEDRAHQMQSSMEPFTAIDLLKRPPSTIHLKSTRQANNSYLSFLNESFEDSSEGNRILIGQQGVDDSGLCFSLNISELYGDISVNAKRETLGVYRFLASEHTDSIWLRRDSLRLLRQSRNKKKLRSALRRTNIGGPLRAIIGDATQVLSRRMLSERISSGELAVLATAAPLLDANRASSALDIILATRHQAGPLRPGHWESSHVRVEEIWSAAVPLAETADKLSDAASTFLQDIRQPAIPTDEILDITYAKILQMFHRDKLDSKVVHEWTDWLDITPSPQFPKLTKAASEIFRGEYVEQQELGATDPNIQQIADYINQAAITSISVPENYIESATNTLIGQMSNIRAHAANGRFSMWSISAAEVAVALAMRTKTLLLWQKIAEFLSDPKVARDDKDRALERIASSPTDVPDHFATLLTPALPGLLTARDRLFTRSLTPYPAALRCAAALGILKDGRLLVEVAKLSASMESNGRFQAARTLSTIARQSTPPAWALALAFQLANDADAGTKAEAGRCIVLLASTNEELAPEANDRAVRLLSEDGVMVPFLLLRGLEEQSEPIPQVIIAKIRDLSFHHAHRAVRSLASELLVKST